MTDLEHHLRELLADKAREIEIPTVALSPRARRRIRRRRALLVASPVVVVVVVVLAAALAVAQIVADDGDERVLTGSTKGANSTANAGDATSNDATITVSVDAAGLGPLRLAVGPLQASEEAWRQHDLTFENTGDREVFIDDTRTGRPLGPVNDRALVVADEGCGAVTVDTTHDSVICTQDQRLLSVPPRGSVSVTMRLWRGSLAPGNYVFENTIRWRTDRDFEGDEREDQRAVMTGTLQLTYHVE